MWRELFSLDCSISHSTYTHACRIRLLFMKMQRGSLDCMWDVQTNSGPLVFLIPLHAFLAFILSEILTYLYSIFTQLLIVSFNRLRNNMLMLRIRSFSAVSCFFLNRYVSVRQIRRSEKSVSNGLDMSKKCSLQLTTLELPSPWI